MEIRGLPLNHDLLNLTKLILTHENDGEERLAHGPVDALSEGEIKALDAESRC
jgi:hypothetical protein